MGRGQDAHVHLGTLQDSALPCLSLPVCVVSPRAWHCTGGGPADRHPATSCVTQQPGALPTLQGRLPGTEAKRRSPPGGDAEQSAGGSVRRGAGAEARPAGWPRRAGCLSQEGGKTSK